MSNAPQVHWPSLHEMHTLVFDFDGVFTDNKVYFSQDGMEWVSCDRRDGLAIDMLRRYREKTAPNLDFFVLSTEQNPVVAARARKLRMDYKQGVGDKLRFMERYLAERHPGMSNVFAGLVYLGNDLNDLPVLERAGFSIVPSDAHEYARQAASVVLPQSGGNGFVRAAIERLINIPDMTREKMNELIRNR